jgi:hypothetical protein
MCYEDENCGWITIVFILEERFVRLHSMLTFGQRESRVCFSDESETRKKYVPGVCFTWPGPDRCMCFLGYVGTVVHHKQATFGAGYRCAVYRKGFARAFWDAGWWITLIPCHGGSCSLFLLARPGLVLLRPVERVGEVNLKTGTGAPTSGEETNR